MNMMQNGCIYQLVNIGIAHDDAVQLRRIAMTLHRWHELECGDVNDYASALRVREHEILLELSAL